LSVSQKATSSATREGEASKECKECKHWLKKGVSEQTQAELGDCRLEPPFLIVPGIPLTQFGPLSFHPVTSGSDCCSHFTQK